MVTKQASITTHPFGSESETEIPSLHATALPNNALHLTATRVSVWRGPSLRSGAARNRAAPPRSATGRGAAGERETVGQTGRATQNAQRAAPGVAPRLSPPARPQLGKQRANMNAREIEPRPHMLQAVPGQGPAGHARHSNRETHPLPNNAMNLTAQRVSKWRGPSLRSGAARHRAPYRRATGRGAAGYRETVGRTQTGPEASANRAAWGRRGKGTEKMRNP